MSDLSNGYRFLAAFIYPATLGAALAWTIQALVTALDGSALQPSLWTLLFGLWFVLYHSLWYWFLITAPRETGKDIPVGYRLRSFWTDILDTAAMMLGLGALGFATGHYDKVYVWLVFLAVAILVGSAAFANYPRWQADRAPALKDQKKSGPGTYLIPFLLAFAIPASGVVLHFRRGMTEEIAWLLLILLYCVLLVYARRPGLFSSHSTPKAC